jgi:nucleotide-binding universal stress UspA family protein
MANDSEVRPVVVGVDGSPASRAAPRWAVEDAAWSWAAGLKARSAALLGSVSAYRARHASCPVVVIRSAPEADHAADHG